MYVWIDITPGSYNNHLQHSLQYVAIKFVNLVELAYIIE